MFNYHQFDKKIKDQEQVENQKNEFIKQQNERKKVREKKAQQYKKRIENFVISMLETPQVLQHYEPLAHKFRDEHPELQLADPQIYINTFKHEYQRIRHLEEQQRILDYEPISTKFLHHTFRDRQPELEGPKMRYTCQTSIERMEETINQKMQTQVENQDFRNKKKKKGYSFLSNREHMTAQEKREEMAKELAKNLLPSLHNKTHFQATESLYNQLPLSLNDANKKGPGKPQDQRHQQFDGNIEQKESSKELAKGSEKMPKINQKQNKDKVVSISDETMTKSKPAADPDDEPESALKKKKNVNQLEAFNTFEASKKVLTTCNVIKQKNPKVQTLYKGTGHSVASPDKSISEVYNEIIHKNKYSRNCS